MTTVRQIIADAYEESRLIPLGGTPEAEEHSKGLRRLNTVVRSLFGNELGEQLKDVPFGLNGITLRHTDYQDQTSTIRQNYLPVNTRLVANLDEANTLYLPPSPNDGCRFAVIDASGNFATRNLVLNGNGRKIENATSVTLSTNGLVREWFYRADLSNWVRVDTLTDNSDSPFPEEFDDFLVTMLALRLSPSFGKEMSAESVSALTRSKAQFRSRYRQTVQVGSERGLLLPQSWGVVPSGFEIGRP